VAADGGALRLDVELEAGVVRGVAIRSSRPMRLGRLLHGRRAEEAPEIVGRLFALCARSHAAAAHFAVAAALGRAPDAETLRAQAVAALAERAFETLRASALGWPGVAPDRETGLRLREAAVAAHGLAAGGAGEALATLNRAAAALGFAHRPSSQSVFGQILRQCEAGPALALTPPDPLSAKDDAEVAAALLADPESFAAAPTLPGRRPETGAYARAWLELARVTHALAARADTRALDARRTLNELEGLALSRRTPGRDLVAWGRLGERAGYGAVETARGRLHHVLSCDGRGRILIYGMVAPTEWNFHARGPLVGQLVGARLGRLPAARGAAETLALLIDPCCACETAVREM